MKKKRSVSLSLPDVLFPTIFAGVMILLQAAVLQWYSGALIVGIFFLVIYAAGVFAYLWIRRTRRAAKSGEVALSEVVSVLSDAMIHLESPVLICPSDSERIIWHNKAADPLFAGVKKGVRLKDLFVPITESDEEAQAATDKEMLTAAGRIYLTGRFEAEGKDGRHYQIVVLDDVTEQKRREDSLKGKECAVAYVMVDNLEELLNYEQEDYRSASGETERLLRSWAAGAGGVLKEYQQDRYIFFFEQSHLAEFMDSGFGILDDIRDIRVGETSIPVTVSMGICATGETLTEKEKAAQAALDTALQRGGDQVVVKSDGAVDIYGGKTKMPQKRTKVRARVIANELISRISMASNVIIMVHRYADFDAFGAAVGLARLTLFCGVSVNIVVDPDDSNLDRCREWLADEQEYGSMFVSADEALDLVHSDTLLIIADVNNPTQFESQSLYRHCSNIAIIDHHRKTIEYERPPLITYIEPSAAAASELVAEMLEQVLPAEELLPHEADLLLAGILLDTNHFTKNTGTRTFSAALYLRSRGAEVGEVQEFFKTELDEFQRELKFHSNVELYRGIAAIATTHEECSVQDKIPAAKAADRLLSVEGVKASFAIVPIGSEVHVSARSAGAINVQLLLEGLQGGGHYDSAGTRMADITVEQAIELLKSAIDRYLDEAASAEKERAAKAATI